MAEAICASKSTAGPAAAHGHGGDGAFLWTLTFGLIVYFLIASFVAALVSLHFGWIDSGSAI